MTADYANRWTIHTLASVDLGRRRTHESWLRSPGFQESRQSTDRFPLPERRAVETWSCISSRLSLEAFQVRNTQDFHCIGS